MNAAVIDFAPLIPWPVIIGLTGLALAACGLGAALRLPGWLWRGLAALGIALALSNPSLVEEEREPLADVAVMVTDRSPSMEIGDRMATADAFGERLRAAAESDPQLELIEVDADTDGDGTRLFDAVGEALGAAPRDRIAGLFIVSDGQIHDAPTDPDSVDIDAPLHHVVIGDRDSGDRRLVIEEAPRYGIVGQTADFVIRVEDPAVDGSALVSFRFEGGEPQTHRVTIGRSTRVQVPVERRGPNVIEAEVEAGPQELSLINNRAAVSVSGVRDRLRVLLVTGEPHNGARAWRDLLKSDPAVDLVHFTILRPPDRQDGTPIEELALIAFPTRELFEERLSEFDLVIFDRYRRRGIMPMLYLDHVARFVEDGGALLVTAGPPFAGPPSLYRTPLSAVLPVRPTGYVTEGPFLPQQTRDGLRHPVTRGLAQGGEEPSWGRWFRHIQATNIGGEALLETPDGHPLLVLQRAGEGRVAIVMSDQTWLWARGFEGGGPYAEMFRRVAHWLMREPELDEERLSAVTRDGELEVERATLEDQPPELEIEWPDGRSETASMSPVGEGRFGANLPAIGAGLVRLRSGQLTTVAALGPLNPLEYADLRPTDDVLAPFVEAGSGGAVFAGEGDSADLPGLRRTRVNADQAGRSWLGLQRNERYRVLAATRAPLMPALLLVLAIIALAGLGWWREGR